MTTCLNIKEGQFSGSESHNEQTSTYPTLLQSTHFKVTFEQSRMQFTTIINVALLVAGSLGYANK